MFAMQPVYNAKRAAHALRSPTMNSVATTFDTQPVCNAAWLAHSLRLNQKLDLDFLVLTTPFQLVVAFATFGLD
jgi:hypothetical protein